MAGSNYLLDTVIIAAYFNREEVIRQKLKDITVYTSSITIGELFFGAYNSQQVVNNVQQIRDFLTISSVLACDENTADYYGQIKRLLRTKGRPIPENDIWIAAIAIQHSLTLISRDAHFNEIETLQLENW